MKVKEIIEALQRMPENMEVYASFGSRMPNKVEWVEKASDLGVVVIHSEK